MNDQNILYGGELSYFTGKARAYLRWKGVSFEERVATRQIYETIIIPRIGYPIIPLVITPKDEAIQDTSEIIDYFEAKEPTPSVIPEGPKQHLAARLLEIYGDEWLVIPAMHYRWTYNKDFALGEFGKLTAPESDEATQRAAAEKASAMFQDVVPLLGATPEMGPSVEASYEALLDELNAHFSEHDYLLGGRPSVGDFGLIGPLYAHQYRDPASGELMKRRSPKVVEWVLRMQNPPTPRQGDFLPGDEIPETLVPVLQRMMREQGPCLVDLVDKVAAWKEANADADIPRMIGMHPFTLEGNTGERLIIPYTQWMLQRAMAALDAGNTDIVGFLEKIGGDALLNLDIKAPVARQNYRLVWA